MSSATIGRITLFAACCVALVAAQSAYDAARTRAALPAQVPSAAAVKAFDLGLDSAAAALSWIEVRSELPFFPDGRQHFFAALALVNALDPRFSEPYAFSVLVLPWVKNFPDHVQAALQIGERGLAQSDPDWRIPFYMGAAYQLQLHDQANTLRYFDIAARTPGAPDYIRRFSKNYGLNPLSFESTAEAWALVAATTKDPATRDRAKGHIAQLALLQYLTAAVQAYHARHGAYPAALDALVSDKLIPGVPADPLGGTFRMYDKGIVGIAP